MVTCVVHFNSLIKNTPTGKGFVELDLLLIYVTRCCQAHLHKSTKKTTK